jgi:hypothetical protein
MADSRKLGTVPEAAGLDEPKGYPRPEAVASECRQNGQKFRAPEGRPAGVLPPGKGGPAAGNSPCGSVILFFSVASLAGVVYYTGQIKHP